MEYLTLIKDRLIMLDSFVSSIRLMEPPHLGPIAFILDIVSKQLLDIPYLFRLGWNSERKIGWHQLCPLIFILNYLL